MLHLLTYISFICLFSVSETVCMQIVISKIGSEFFFFFWIRSYCLIKWPTLFCLCPRLCDRRVCVGVLKHFSCGACLHRHTHTERQTSEATRIGRWLYLLRDPSPPFNTNIHSHTYTYTHTFTPTLKEWDEEWGRAEKRRGEREGGWLGGKYYSFLAALK